MALNLQHQTPAEFSARFWSRVKQAYQSGDKLTYHKLIWWIWSKIQSGDLTSNQVRLSFNSVFDRTLDTTQWNNLVTTRFIPMKDRYLALISEGDL